MTSASAPVVLTQELVTALPRQALGHLPGTHRRILWQDGESEAGVLEIDAGHHLGAHTHRANHHHLWVLQGRALVLGEELGTGAYVHIPHGIEHDIEATGTEGCTVFYVYGRG